MNVHKGTCISIPGTTTKNDTSTPQLSLKVAFSIFLSVQIATCGKQREEEKLFFCEKRMAPSRDVFGSAVSHTNSESSVQE